MGYTLISNFIGWRRDGKITFSRTEHGNGSVSFRLSGYLGRREKVLHKMIVELTESVMAPYGVFSFLKCLGSDLLSHQKPRKKYESDRGLAEDIYEYLKKTETEPVWRTDRAVALWSQGHHRKLVRYLDESCRSKYRIAPYWNGEFYLYGFRNASSGETVWNRFLNGDISADLIVTYKDATRIWVDFRLRQNDHDEEKRICRLVKETCNRHRIKPILQNIDPAMMELGYEI